MGATTNNYLSDDGFLQIKGEPGTAFNLTLQTQNTRLVSVTMPGRLDVCPLGFSLENHECICSTSTLDKKLVGVAECDMCEFLSISPAGLLGRVCEWGKDGYWLLSS